ncbi:HAD family hydrolase [Streptomyces sp. NPDC048441]|uniref:HAD family hydrolase n=1 Tax=Streptomyces sp. NPDC048441 TaxID=3365552 RepID=UPI003717A283
MQRLALFDLDNTLVNRQRALEACLSVFCEERALGAEAVGWMRGALAQRAYPSDFAELRERFRLAEPVESLWAAYVRTLAANVECPGEILDGLDQLQGQGWSVAVVTNGAEDIQRAKLVRSGIASRINAYCVSGEFGVRKPDPLPLQVAARRCGRAIADGGWMVGDGLATDVAAGRAAGLHTIWVSNGKPWPEGPGRWPEPDHIAPHVLTALDHLLSLPGAPR